MTLEKILPLKNVAIMGLVACATGITSVTMKIAEFEELEQTDIEKVRSLIEHEQEMRPFVIDLIEKAERLDAEKVIPGSDKTFVGALEESSDALSTMFESGRYRKIDFGDSNSIAGYFTVISETRLDDAIVLNTKFIENLDVGTLMHEAMHHYGVDHSEVLKQQIVESSLEATVEFGDIVVNNQDIHYETSVLYTTVDAPHMILQQSRDNDLLTELRLLPKEEQISAWTEMTYESVQSLSSFGISKEDIRAVYGSEKYFDYMREQLSELQKELDAEKNFEIKSEREREGRSAENIHYGKRV